MDAILPAAGLASRMRGIPKFLLPIDKAYISLLEVHISNLSDICERIYLPTRPELAPIIKSLDFNLGRFCTHFKNRADSFLEMSPSVKVLNLLIYSFRVKGLFPAG